MVFKFAYFVEHSIGYQPAKFQCCKLSGSSFTERLQKHSDDVTSQYLVFKIVHFVELNRRYQLAKFHWPKLSGSTFKRPGGKHLPKPYTLSKSPVLIGLNLTQSSPDGIKLQR